MIGKERRKKKERARDTGIMGFFGEGLIGCLVGNWTYGDVMG